MQIFVILLCIFVNGCMSQSKKQCACDDIRSCGAEIQSILLPCADKCKRFAGTLGGDYNVLRACFSKYEPRIKDAVKCTANSFPNACANGAPKMIPDRYAAGLEIAIANEVSSLLGKSGVMDRVRMIYTTGRKFFKCVQYCATKSSCAARLKCGLDLPSDTILVQTGKQCGIRSGFNKALIQEACECLHSAGLKDLDGVCQQLNVS